MLTLINTLSLATALTAGSIITVNVNLTINKNKIENATGTVIDTQKTNQYILLLWPEDKSYTAYRTMTKNGTVIIDLSNLKYIALGYETKYPSTYAITQRDKLNPKETIKDYTYYTNTYKELTEGDNTFSIKTRSSFMEELLTALTTAVQSAVSIFVEGFGGLTQIFYNGTEITFIGGILIVGLAVMFLMMFLRWIVSFVKGI